MTAFEGLLDSVASGARIRPHATYFVDGGFGWTQSDGAQAALKEARESCRIPAPNGAWRLVAGIKPGPVHRKTVPPESRASVMATGCRPEAACELDWSMIDLQAGVIDLNPSGRKQTKKHRPEVRIPPSLRGWLEAQTCREGRLVQYGGKPVKYYYAALPGARNRAGLPQTVNLYSPRHTVARWMRREGVPPWEVAAQLGHGMGGKLSITERYAAASPDYLANACASIERLMQEVAKFSKSWPCAENKIMDAAE